MDMLAWRINFGIIIEPWELRALNSLGIAWQSVMNMPDEPKIARTGNG